MYSCKLLQLCKFMLARSNTLWLEISLFIKLGSTPTICLRRFCWKASSLFLCALLSPAVSRLNYLTSDNCVVDIQLLFLLLSVPVQRLSTFLQVAVAAPILWLVSLLTLHVSSSCAPKYVVSSATSISSSFSNFTLALLFILRWTHFPLFGDNPYSLEIFYMLCRILSVSFSFFLWKEFCHLHTALPQIECR